MVKLDVTAYNIMGAVGYNSLTNSLAQTVASGGIVNLGHVVAASCAQNISTLDGSSLVVNNDGTYNIQVDIMATPSVSSIAQIQLNINGVSRAAIAIPTGAVVAMATYTVRGVFAMSKGDIITVSNNAGAITLVASPVLNFYNVSTIIERYN